MDNKLGISSALRGMPILNRHLHEKCNQYDYVFQLKRYRFREKGQAIYDDSANYDIILCLNYRGKCVSSVSGKFHKDGNAMELISKTEPEYEGRKYNLYLRYAFTYLMYFIRPTIKSIYSFSVNPISTYAMFKHFGASNDDLNEYVRDNHLTQETFSLEDAKKFHQYYHKQHTKTPTEAEEYLDELLEQGYELEEFGWETREEAIEFLISESKHSNAIMLSVELAKTEQAYWLSKLKTILIQCEPARDEPTVYRTRKSLKRKRLTSVSSHKTKSKKSKKSKKTRNSI